MLADIRKQKPMVLEYIGTLRHSAKSQAKLALASVSAPIRRKPLDRIQPLSNGSLEDDDSDVAPTRLQQGGSSWGPARVQQRDGLTDTKGRSKYSRALTML